MIITVILVGIDVTTSIPSMNSSSLNGPEGMAPFD
jgi:hypothetical protein